VSSRAQARDLTKTRESHKLTWALNRVLVRSLAVCAVRDDTCYVPNEGRSSIWFRRQWVEEFARAISD